MFVTLDVLKLLKSRRDSTQQLSNIQLISVTLDVLK